MKKLILAAALVALTGSAMAQEVNVSREALGSGTPGTSGIENAVKWDNNIYHAPQYMPGNPTAATLYPRVVDVPCTQTATGLNCKGYNWLPELGRGEYLMIRPVITEAPKPVIVEKLVPAPYPVPGPERIILKEVPIKKNKE